jgi:hypothetical protein
MKWVALVVILLAIVIVFGIWRRLQAARPTHRPEPPPALELERPIPPVSEPTAPAAEASVDEVPPAPAHEEHPAAAPEMPPHSSGAQDWWKDDGQPRPERT